MAKAILIAEDADDDVLIVLEALKKAGATNPVLTVNDGDLAVAYLKGEGIYANREKYPLRSLRISGNERC